MISENMRELYKLLASIPGQNPRVYGCGARLSSFDRGYRGNMEILNSEADDFAGTEALFLAEIGNRDLSQTLEQTNGQ